MSALLISVELVLFTGCYFLLQVVSFRFGGNC